MTTPSRIVCVTPTIRPESQAKFVKAWGPLFKKHKVTLVTVWDGDQPGFPQIAVDGPEGRSITTNVLAGHGDNRDLFCRRTDACRNLGFVAAAAMNPTHVLTLDDDCYPCVINDPVSRELAANLCDPIQAHLDALDRRVPLGWMNIAHDTDLYVRGVPYGVRDEAPVMLSHGVWVGTPDFDGETQLRLERESEVIPTSQGTLNMVGSGVPHSLPYYVGPIPRGVLFPLCGMNVMVRAEALPYLYFAPMGADSGVKCDRCGGYGLANWGHVRTQGADDKTPCPVCNGARSPLHRFADIFMGVFLKREFDRVGWACVTGYSTIHHTRASDAAKNFEQEKLGREWMEWMSVMSWMNDQTLALDEPPGLPDGMWNYLRSYDSKRTRYATLITNLLEKK